jgi:beta-phosphoglucomutase family hydrolase
MIKAVIFDMDGTIVDNRSYHLKAWLEFTRRQGVPLTEEDYIEQYQGRSNQELMPDMLGRSISKEEFPGLVDEKEGIYRDLYKDVQAVGGFLPLFDEIKKRGLKTGLATTGYEKNRKHVLGQLGIMNEFDVIVGVEDVEKGKPDPEIYLKTAKKLGVDPESCLVFEDSIPGVRSAKSAGMKVMAITTSHAPEKLKEADQTIEDFTQVAISRFL